MLGLEAIASYLPEMRIDNGKQADLYSTDRIFVEQKIGVSMLPRFQDHDSVVSASVSAFKCLYEKRNINLTEIECVVLCTQNPDKNGLPHNSALVHAELGLSDDCACFDIGLGCSGYVYGLSIIQSFMTAHGMKKGLFFTCDPYSKILNPNDKSTSLLFGDAATVTLISDTPNYILAGAKYSTRGVGSEALQIKNNLLEMNGRSVFNFALQYVPKQIKYVLESLELHEEDVDLYLLHQGSKYMLENLVKRANLPTLKTPIDISSTGNTVSSSIPLVFEKYFDQNYERVLMSGFGVGLSWATAIYQKANS